MLAPWVEEFGEWFIEYDANEDIEVTCLAYCLSMIYYYEIGAAVFLFLVFLFTQTRTRPVLQFN